MCTICICWPMQNIVSFFSTFFDHWRHNSAFGSSLIPHCSLLLNYGGWQIAHNPPLFLASVPFALGFRSSSHQNMDSIFPWIWPAWTCFGPFNVIEAALGLSSTFLLALWAPVRLPHDQAWLTCWRTRDHVEQRRDGSRLATSQLSWLQTQNAWMNTNGDRRTTQLNSAQIPDQ